VNDSLKKAKLIAKELFILDGNIEDYTVTDLILVLQTADDLYFNENESFLADDQYDVIKQYANRLDGSNPYFIGVGSEVRGGKIELPYQMGSLTQSYEGDVEKWVEKYKLFTEKICISDKLDGVSALAQYANRNFQIAFSRGDGVEGADISRHLRKMKSVPKNVPTATLEAVRGEIIISEDNFKLMCEHSAKVGGRIYKNARNAVAGIMNASSNPDWMYDYIDFVAYEVVNPNFWSKDVQFENLKNYGFKTAPAFIFDGRRLNDDVLVQLVNSRRDSNKYAIDGIVLEVNDADLRRKINPTKDTLNPEFARKYKVASTDNVAIATVVDVHWNVSKTGYLKPRVEIEPVDLVGVTITYATGFNAKFIFDNKVGPGAKVKITRSGDVIPLILEVVVPMPIENM
jgi:DNA ligase (NAD+)